MPSTIGAVASERRSLAERHTEALRLLRERNDQLAACRLEVAQLRAANEALRSERTIEDGP